MSRSSAKNPPNGQRRVALNLPVELLENILGREELSFRDVLRCKTVRLEFASVTFPRPPNFDANTIADAPLFLFTGKPPS